MSARTFVVLAVLSVSAYSQTSDVTPPALLSFSFSPTSIDTRSGPQTLTFTADASDDLAGIWFFNVDLRSPSRSQVRSVSMVRRSGTALLGTYSATYAFPQFTSSGAWIVDAIRLVDLTGNFIALNTAVLQSRNFPTTFSVVSTPDVTPPRLESLEFTPDAIDVSEAPVTVRARLRLTDTQTGLGIESTAAGCSCTYQFMRLSSPSASETLDIANADFHLVSGTRNDGIWEAAFEMPRYSAPGTWTVQSISLRDAVNNQHVVSASALGADNLATGFIVSSSPFDSTRPTLTSLVLNPTTIDPSLAPKTVTITFGVQDNLSGVDFVRQPICPCAFLGIVFWSPSGNQFATSTFNPFSQVSGTSLNGTWTGTVGFPRFAEAGTWNATIYIKDRALNKKTISTTELQAAGLPSSLIVIRPSYTPDGTVGSAGGVVTDQVFGSQTRLTIPNGVLTRPTTVSLDVLENPPNIAFPQGFSGAASRFVNVDLLPPPGAASGPPGYTLTIPLGAALPAGTELELFRLDPIFGSLVRARGVSAANVKGTVDLGGQTATFTGIASFSTVVGLRPSTQKPGDLNGDNVVNCDDASVVRAAFGKRTGQPGFDTKADVNRDGIVNISDLSFVLRQLTSGSSCQ